MPSSTELRSALLVTLGIVVSGQMVQGQTYGCGGPMMTETPAPGVSMLPLSSSARLLITAGPCVTGVHSYVQLS